VATQTGRQTKKQGDFTGRQAAAEAAKAAQDKKTRDAEIAMINAAEKEEFDNSIFDVTKDPSQPIVVDEVVEVGVEMADDSVVVRVAEDIDNMTVGYKNNYTFKAGGKYQVPKAVADRLEHLGLLWH
jgi:hypothetical protein